MDRRRYILITGDKQLDAALQKMAKEGHASAIGKLTRQGTRKAAKVVLPRARREIRREAWDTGDWEQSVKVRAKKRSRKSMGHLILSGLFQGETFYGGFQEWGWKPRNRYATSGNKIRGKYPLANAAQIKSRQAILAFRATMMRGIREIWKKQ